MSLINCGILTIEAAEMMATPRALEMASLTHASLEEEKSRFWMRDRWHCWPMRDTAKLLRGLGRLFVMGERRGLRGEIMLSRAFMMDGGVQCFVASRVDQCCQAVHLKMTNNNKTRMTRIIT